MSKQQVRDAEATRNRILEAAARLFAERGFDKTGISAIAEAAGINSALIYYYFKNKQALLDELIENFVSGAKSILEELASAEYPAGSPEATAQMRRYDEFLLANEHAVRVITMESLKAGTKSPPLFKLVESGLDPVREKEIIGSLNARGFDLDEDPRQRRVTEFFTGIMPMAIYSIFRSQWSSYFKIKHKDLDQLIEYASESTHRAHYRREHYVSPSATSMRSIL
jgi:AcrR family transcriptional regulator